MSASELVGKTLLDRYYLRERVGSGGMADVYLAWDKMRSAKMAVKVLRRDLSGNASFKQFAHEAELLRKLEHPNIVRIFEFERDEDTVFIVMEWVDGTNLRKAINDRRKPFKLEEVTAILEPVCSALNYAHQNKVYHCDVKPANILVNKTGKVLLSDFGIAQLADERGAGGTPPYMAPEQFSDSLLDARTDVYSLGVTVYEILSGGILPFRGDSPSSRGSTPQDRIEWEHLYLPIPPLHSYNSLVPEAMEQVVMVAMSKEPNNRYPTTLDFLESFERARGVSAQSTGDPYKTILKSVTSAGQNLLTNLEQAIPKAPESAPPSSRPPQSQQPGPAYPASAFTGRPHLYCRSGDYAGHPVPIPSGNLSIGRSSQCNLRIAEVSVSRRHATLVKARKGVYIRDDGSSLGTMVNGVRINGPVLLRHGDIIQIGYQQIFEYREK